jgi:ADP-heptose:LPS heptosyltransferase
MRILASNPDTIGDLVLRQPLYAALRDAGHDLVLLVRPLVAPLVESLLPGVRTIICEADPYAVDPSPDAQDLDEVANAARALDPDFLLIAPYQWTRLEERLAFALPKAGKVAMNGRRYAHERWGEVPPSGIIPTVRVDVDEAARELDKNTALASAILGVSVTLPDPHLVASDAQVTSARRVLDEAGMTPGAFWAACVGETQWTSVRNWPIEQWGRTLAAWGAAHDRRFLLLGHESEAEASNRVAETMGDQRHRAALWSGVDSSDLDTLIGLLALSRGYVGRDTGPMHLAAALGKPVLAVFGGGTWPRFLPAARVGVSISMRVPCMACGWRCHLTESVCIKQVPEVDVLRAAEQLEAGAIQSNEVRTIEPSREVLVRIGTQGMLAAHDLSSALATQRRLELIRTEHLARAIERNSERLSALERARNESQATSGEHGATPSVSRFESEHTSRALAEARVQLAESQRRVLELEEQHARTLLDLEALRAEARDERLLLERERDRTATLDALTRQTQIDLDGTFAELERVRQLLRDVKRQRDELLSSRWRRYGQKVGLVMVMPWERQSENGQRS